MDDKKRIFLKRLLIVFVIVCIVGVISSKFSGNRSAKSQAFSFFYREKDLDKLFRKCPYVGMSERAINDTKCGHYSTSEQIKHYVEPRFHYDNKYIWYAANREDIPLTVVCCDGKVITVNKHYKNNREFAYWDDKGYPTFDYYRETHHYYVDDDDEEEEDEEEDYRAHNSSGSSKKDFYDIEDYDEVDDFINDHGDDFESDEEAEDYFYDYY